MRTAARASLSTARGAHALKIGLEYEDNRLEEGTDFSAQPGSPGDRPSASTTPRTPGLRLRVQSAVHNRVPSVYAQDSWRATSRVTLNVGVRWDGQYFIGPAGDVAQSFTDQWQPRIGLIYGLGARGPRSSWVLRAILRANPADAPSGYYGNPQPLVVLEYRHDPRIDPTGADTIIDLRFVPAEVEPRRDRKASPSTSSPSATSGRSGRFGRESAESTAASAGRWRMRSYGGGKIRGRQSRARQSVFTPRARRTYTAMVVTVEKPAGGRFDFLGSYVLSRSWGNYSGLYDFSCERGRA